VPGIGAVSLAASVKCGQLVRLWISAQTDPDEFVECRCVVVVGVRGCLACVY